MKHMDELRDMLCEELDKIAEQGQLSANSLDMVDKLTHSIKSIDTIEAMEGGSHDDMSYRSYEGRNRRSRDYDGTYERGGNRRSNRRGRSNRSYRSNNYSMAEEKDYIIGELEELMQDADAGTKAAIKKAIHTLEE